MGTKVLSVMLMDLLEAPKTSALGVGLVGVVVGGVPCRVWVVTGAAGVEASTGGAGGSTGSVGVTGVGTGAVTVGSDGGGGAGASGIDGTVTVGRLTVGDGGS